MQIFEREQKENVDEKKNW